MQGKTGSSTCWHPLKLCASWLASGVGSSASRAAVTSNTLSHPNTVNWNPTQKKWEIQQCIYRHLKHLNPSAEGQRREGVSCSTHNFWLVPSQQKHKKCILLAISQSKLSMVYCRTSSNQGCPSGHTGQVRFSLAHHFCLVNFFYFILFCLFVFFNCWLCCPFFKKGEKSNCWHLTSVFHKMCALQSYTWFW